MVEPVTGSNCRIIPPDGYMQKLRKICDEYGILLICDEVMSGFGRTGEWFACQHWNVTLDIMSVSKGINNGCLPLGAVVTNKKIADYFSDHLLYAGLTQYGNPIACASAIAIIVVYILELFIKSVRELGIHLVTRLHDIKENHPCIGDVRGLGLFGAVELVQDRKMKTPLVPCTSRYYVKKHPLAAKLVEKLRSEGVATYMRWNVLMICPPLCITKSDLDSGLDIIDHELGFVDEWIKKQK
jgi:taurine--2-oxoglutarate transaminase